MLLQKNKIIKTPSIRCGVGSFDVMLITVSAAYVVESIVESVVFVVL
jgi:hypothetical protein